MCKARWMLMLLLATFLAPAAHAPAEAEAEAYEVLVLYAPAPGAASQQDLSVLSEVLAYMGKKTAFVRAGDAEEWPAYNVAIVLLDSGDVLTPDEARLLSRREALVLGSGGLREIAGAAGLPEPEGYEGADVRIHTSLPGGEEDNRYQRVDTLLSLAGESGSEDWMRVGGVQRPLFTTAGKLSHMAYFDSGDNALVSALATFIQNWLWPYLDSPPSYGQYVVLNEVYPFFDPNGLMDVHALLESMGIPYAISVMPVFQNAEFPAMQRFCEFLRYAQSRGASIVLRCPQVHIADVQPEELMRHLDTSYGAYARYGVYPVALEAPKAWLYHETGIATLRRFRTVLLFDTDEPQWVPGTSTNEVWQDGHVLIAPAFHVEGRAYASTSAFSSAVYLDAREDLSVLEQELTTLLHARVQMHSLAKIPASVYLNEYSYNTEGGKPLYNGNPVSLDYAPFTYDERFSYDRGLLGSMRRQLMASNQVITFFTLVACLLFFFFLWRGRHAIRRELFHRKGGRSK